MPARLWLKMKRPEIEQAVKECDICLLPIGSTEQHGEHLPCGADFFNAVGIAERVSERTGVIVAPPLPYGSHPYFHYGYLGTLPIRQTVQIELVRDIVKSLVNCGFTKIIIVNAHGQWWSLNTAIQEIALDVDAFLAVPTWQEVAAPTIREVLDTPPRHADESETAVALELYPELVDMTKAKDEALVANIDKKFIKVATHGDGSAALCLEAITAWPQESTVMKYGVAGNPTLATKEKGHAIVEATVKWICDLIEDLRKRYPVGQYPSIKPKLKVDYY